MARRKTVAVDFDGVIHSYKSGWKGVHIIPDEPVPGIGDAIAELRTRYRVVVFSARAAREGGTEAIAAWLEKWDIEVDDITSTKPPAFCTVDDRSICFDGDAASLVEKVDGFAPWTQRESEGSRRVLLDLKGYYESMGPWRSPVIKAGPAVHIIRDDGGHYDLSVNEDRQSEVAWLGFDNGAGCLVELLDEGSDTVTVRSTTGDGHIISTVVFEVYKEVVKCW